MMKVKDGQCRVAVVQAEPVMFDKKACLSKALSLFKKAAKGGRTGSVIRMHPLLWVRKRRKC